MGTTGRQKARDPAQRLGDILVANGSLTATQLADALASRNGTKKPLGDCLADAGYVTAEHVAEALAQQLSIPYFEPDEDFRLEREEVKLIPEALARKYCLFPVHRGNVGYLTIVMRDPIDIQALDVVRSHTKLAVRKAVATEAFIHSVIDRFYSEEAYVDRSLQDVVDHEFDTGHDETATANIDAEQLRVIANDAPVVRFVNLLFMEAVRDRASDIHIEPGEHVVRVRLRIDGRLREVVPPPKSLHQAVVTRIKILAGMDIAERRLPLDGRLKFQVQGRVIDMRVSSLPEVHGEKLVMRVLDRSAVLTDMRDIGLRDNQLRKFQQILKQPNGIILLTGPTGSGKTSTLYSALNFLKSPELNIQTVEDPVEYLVGGINQMPIRSKIGLDFANALRSILRQDPDVIMIGEIRDLETARIAMQASLTGHLVLSTLHTNDSASAFNRLKDLGVEPYLIAATVNLVISQRLVRIICSRCKTEVQPEPEHRALVNRYFEDGDTWTFYHGAGCEACGKTGFLGRTATVEFLEVTDAVRDMVTRCTATHELRDHVVRQGMAPLLLDGLQKVRDGITTIEEILAVSPPETQ